MGTIAATMRVWIDGAGPFPGRLDIDHEVRTERFGQLSEPDLDWEFTDAAGHFHAYAAEGGLPTLDRTSRHVECEGGCGLGDSCEGYDVWVYHCRICGEEIEPGLITRYDVTKTYPGLTSWGVQVHGADHPSNDIVSVRCRWNDREWFGMGSVVEWTSNDGQAQLGIVGNGELGERHAPTAPARQQIPTG